jgi:phenylalanyl-tRNA synthetase beta chain
MRLLISWARDFVDVTAPVEQIAETLALRGFEYASVETLEGGDGVIDFEVTANRPDCLSVIGFARELATVYGLPFRPPSTDRDAKVQLAPIVIGESAQVAVTIADTELCPRYAAAVAEVAPSSSDSPGSPAASCGSAAPRRSRC